MEGKEAEEVFPLEVWLEIGYHCDLNPLVYLSMTCTSLNRLLDVEKVWRDIFKMKKRIKPFAVIPPPDPLSTVQFPSVPFSWKYCSFFVREFDTLDEAWAQLKGGERVFIAPGIYEGQISTSWPDEEQEIEDEEEEEGEERKQKERKERKIPKPVEIIGEGVDVVTTPFNPEEVPEKGNEEEEEEEEEGKEGKKEESKKKQKVKKPVAPPSRVMFLGATPIFLLYEPIIFRNICFGVDVSADQTVGIEVRCVELVAHNCMFRGTFGIVALDAPRVELKNCKFESFVGICLDKDRSQLSEEQQRNDMEQNVLVEKCSFEFEKAECSMMCRNAKACITVNDCTIKGNTDSALYYRRAKKITISNTHISKSFRAVTFGKQVTGATISGCTFVNNTYEVIYCEAPQNFVMVKNTKIDSRGGMTIGGYKMACNFSTVPGEENEIEEDNCIAPICMDAVNKRKCTYTTTGKEFYAQYWWRCLTCNYPELTGICWTCHEICHKGHLMEATWGYTFELPEGGTIPGNFSLFYCDCGSTYGHVCKAL